MPGLTFGAGMRDYDDVSYTLGNSGIYKFGGKVGYDLTKRLELFTALDFEHFRYGRSSSAYDAIDKQSYYEPDSFTDVTTARLGLAYHLK